MTDPTCKLNTQTSIQGFYKICGSIPVGRLPGTIKGTFKTIMYTCTLLLES
jgi:hypothetical protein